MKKSVIQEAIKDQIGNRAISEGPISSMKKAGNWVAKQRVFDPVARGTSAVGNMFANIGGQMKLGAVNKQLNRSADRIQDEWNKSSDVIADKAAKMMKSSNPRIKAAGDAVLTNKDNIDKQIDGASNQMKQIAKVGADQMSQPNQKGVSDIEKAIVPSVATDEYGNKYTEYGVDKWLKRMGINPHDIGKTQKNNYSKIFMDLVAANVNPMTVPADKQLPIIHFAASQYSAVRHGQATPQEVDAKIKQVIQQYLGGGNPPELATPAGISNPNSQQKQGETAGLSDKDRLQVAHHILNKLEGMAVKQNLQLNDDMRKNIMNKVVGVLNKNPNITNPKQLIASAMEELRKQAPVKPKNMPQVPPNTQQFEKAAAAMPPSAAEVGMRNAPPPLPARGGVTPPRKAPQAAPTAPPLPSAQTQPEPQPIPLTQLKPHQPKMPEFEMPPEMDEPQSLSSFVEPQLSSGKSQINPSQMLPKSIQKPGPLPVKDNGSEITVGSEDQPGFGPGKKPAQDPQKSKSKKKEKSK